ncbi:MAG: hypothetical protein VX589_11805 [Myxococcota bacterium]|nr:hypothetical protein [Myxococcota bacterium]
MSDGLQKSWGVGVLGASLIGFIAIQLAALNDRADHRVLWWVEGGMALVVGLVVMARCWPDRWLSRFSRRTIPFGHWSFGRWTGVYVVLVMVAGYTFAETRAGDRYVRLGGWTAGHGGFFAKALGTITGEYAIITNWNAARVGAVRNDGLFAATVHRSDLRIWSVAAEEEMCRLTLPVSGLGITDAVWSDDGLIVTGPGDGARTNVFRVDISIGADGASCALHEVAALRGIRALCMLGTELRVARVDHQTAFVTAVNVIQNPDENRAQEHPSLGDWAVGLTGADSTPAITFSPDCAWVAIKTGETTMSSSDDEDELISVGISVETVEISTGLRRRYHHRVPAKQHWQNAEAELALSADADRLALFVFPDLWLVEAGEKPVRFTLPDRDENTGAGRLVRPFYGPDMIQTLQFTSDNRLIFRTVRRIETWRTLHGIVVIDPSTMRILDTYSTHLEAITDVYTSRNGRFLLTTAYDFEAHVIRLPSAKSM